MRERYIIIHVFFYLCDYTPVLIFDVAFKRQFVFHAELGSYQTYQKGSIWIDDKVNTNVGNAYDPIALGNSQHPQMVSTSSIGIL